MWQSQMGMKSIQLLFLGGGFQMVFIFTSTRTWGNDSIWLICFKWVETNPVSQRHLDVFCLWRHGGATDAMLIFCDILVPMFHQPPRRTRQIRNPPRNTAPKTALLGVDWTFCCHQFINSSSHRWNSTTRAVYWWIVYWPLSLDKTLSLQFWMPGIFSNRQLFFASTTWWIWYLFQLVSGCLTLISVLLKRNISNLFWWLLVLFG